MGIDPQQPQGAAPPACARGGGGHRPDRQTVVAADHDRCGTVRQRGRGGLVQLPAHAGDLPDVFLAWLTRCACFAHRVAEIALINHRVAERREPGAQLSNPEGRWAHVDAASPRPEVEWYADQLQGPWACHVGEVGGVSGQQRGTMLS